MTVHSPLLNGSQTSHWQGAILVPNSRLARGNGLLPDGAPLLQIQLQPHCKTKQKIHNFVWFVLGGWSWIWGEGPPEQNTAKKDHQETLFKGPRKAVVPGRYKIAPNRFKTTYRSVLTFEEKKQSITHLFKTFTGLRLVCNASILAERLENTVNWTFQNQRHFECEIPRELF